MIITIKPIDIKEDEANKVTSDKIFKSRKILGPDGRYMFDAEGIFSEKIFGKFGHCTCGKLRTPGYCKECGCRVLDHKNMPDFYIEFEFDLPNRSIDYEEYNQELIENLLYFNGFIYDGEYVEFNLKDDMSQYEEDKILIGKDAILSCGISEEWYNKNVHRRISIPHTSYRKITFQNNEYFIGNVNTLYIDMIRLNKRYNRLKHNSKLTILNELNIRYMACRDLENLYTELFMVLAKNHKNIIANELRGQPETGMIRAVMTNNFGLDEDTLLIGKYFISTLYPKLYQEHLIGNEPDIDAINKILADEEYLVLFNRQPTIGAKSIIAMKPVFTKTDAEQFVIQANPIVYDGLAADVDGDSLNVIALYSKEANKEAVKLLASNNYIEGSNSSIRNGIIDEFKYVKTVKDGKNGGN